MDQLLHNNQEKRNRDQNTAEKPTASGKDKEQPFLKEKEQKISDRKKILRKQIRNQKALLTTAYRREESQKICDRIAMHPLFRQAHAVLLYAALPDEVDTQALLFRFGQQKHLILPVVTGDRLTLKAYQGPEHLSTDNRFQIPEPDGAELINPHIDLLLVPGMAFDAQGNRLGRGKGFYDRLLQSDLARHLPKIGICFDCQILPEVPVEPHDIAMDEVLTAQHHFKRK